MTYSRIIGKTVGYAVLAILLSVCSCQRTEDMPSVTADIPEADLTAPLAVSAKQTATWQDSTATRGLDPIEDDGSDTGLNRFGFGLIGCWSASANLLTASDQVMYIQNNRMIHRNGDAEHSFSGDPQLYWVKKGCLSFFGYAPYDSDGSSFGISVQDYDRTASIMPQIRYTASGDASRISNQPDLVVSSPVMNVASPSATYGPSSVSLQFHHTLTRILFEAKYTGAIPAGMSVKVDEVTLLNVIGTKVLTFRNPDTGNPLPFTWQADEDYSSDVRTDYTIYRNQNQLTSTALSSSALTPLQQMNGRLYLLPQHITRAGNLLSLTYSFVSSNDVIYSQFKRQFSLVPTSFYDYYWEPGHTVRYTFNIDINAREVTLTYDDLGGTGTWITDWTPSGSDGSDRHFQ